jgi:hypothetical protein
MLANILLRVLDPYFIRFPFLVSCNRLFNIMNEENDSNDAGTKKVKHSLFSQDNTSRFCIIAPDFSMNITDLFRKR